MWSEKQTALEALLYEGHYPAYWAQISSRFPNTWVRVNDLNPDNEEVLSLQGFGYFMIDLHTGDLVRNDETEKTEHHVWVSLRKTGNIIECMRRNHPYLSVV